jgi:acetoin utilization protein AcuB
MKASTPIKDIMTRDVVTVGPQETLAVVSEKMNSLTAHHMPVIEDGKIAGMISMNDINKMQHHFTIFNNSEAKDSNRQLFASMLAKDIMTTTVTTVHEDDNVGKAVDLLLENMFHALPVINHEEQLVGIITTFDLIKHSLD